MKPKHFKYSDLKGKRNVNMKVSFRPLRNEILYVSTAFPISSEGW